MNEDYIVTIKDLETLNFNVGLEKTTSFNDINEFLLEETKSNNNQFKYLFFMDEQKTQKCEESQTLADVGFVSGQSLYVTRVPIDFQPQISNNVQIIVRQDNEKDITIDVDKSTTTPIDILEHFKLPQDHRVTWIVNGNTNLLSDVQYQRTLSQIGINQNCIFHVRPKSQVPQSLGQYNQNQQLPSTFQTAGVFPGQTAFPLHQFNPDPQQQPGFGLPVQHFPQNNLSPGLGLQQNQFPQPTFPQQPPQFPSPLLPGLIGVQYPPMETPPQTQTKGNQNNKLSPQIVQKHEVKLPIATNKNQATCETQLVTIVNGGEEVKYEDETNFFSCTLKMNKQQGKKQTEQVKNLVKKDIGEMRTSSGRTENTLKVEQTVVAFLKGRKGIFVWWKDKTRSILEIS